MLRFIIERHEFCMNTGRERRDHFTHDIDIPELEAMLKRGGKGEAGFDQWRLLGVELLPDEARDGQ